MSIITALVSTEDGFHLFGADMTGTLFAWSLGRIFQEHMSRQEEIRRNNNVYTFVAKWRICSQEILHLNIYQQYLLISTSHMLYRLPLSVFFQYIEKADNAQSQNPNLIDLQEMVLQHSLHKLKAHYSQDFYISVVLVDNPYVFLGSHCGRLFVIDISKEDIVQVIDVIDVVNDVVKSMVPILKNPITTLNKINSNELLIGSQLGLLLILRLQESTFSSYLKYPDKTQTLSPVIKTIYNKNQCLLISLHEEHMAIWNLTVQNLVELIPINTLTDISLTDNGILITGRDDGQVSLENINEKSQKRTVSTSQSIVAGLYQIEGANGKQIFFVRGNTPFVDVFRSNNYQFSVAGL